MDRDSTIAYDILWLFSVSDATKLSTKLSIKEYPLKYMSVGSVDGYCRMF